MPGYEVIIDGSQSGISSDREIVDYFWGSVFNIGIDKPELSVLDFAKIFIKKGKKIFGYDKQLLFKQSTDLNYLEDNPNRRCPNIIKAKTELTYDPSIDPNEGVERYLTHLKLNGNK